MIRVHVNPRYVLDLFRLHQFDELPLYVTLEEDLHSIIETPILEVETANLGKHSVFEVLEKCHQKIIAAIDSHADRGVLSGVRDSILKCAADYSLIDADTLLSGLSEDLALQRI